MATAQMPAGPRSARLADDAATAALYATQPRKTDRDAPATPSTPEPNSLAATGGASNLSAASAGAALAHANQRTVEPWRPGRLTDAEKAASSVRDFTPPEVPQNNTKYSAEGLGAAILAVREQQKNSSQSPARAAHKHQPSAPNDSQHKALQAATGAFATRKRSGSAPLSSLAPETPAPYDLSALSAAGATHKTKPEEEGPLDHLDSSMEASRIRHIARTNAQLYTSTPPVSLEVEERNRQNSLRAAALSMAKDMYDITATKTESNADPALVAAQTGSARLQSRKSVSGTEGNTARRAMTLQDAAQKRASEKLARMQEDPRHLQTYYGTAPQPRSRLSTRRRRTSSDADASQVDAEQSRRIHKQMTSLRTKLTEVDEKRTQDREMLMEAARRNVDATIQGMEMKMYLDTGRAPPSLQKEWDEVAQERVRQEAEAASVSTGNGRNNNRVSLGGQQYMDMADIEAVARSRIQPALDEIDDQVEKRKAKELEARLDAEERGRQAALEKERDASVKAAERRTKAEKRESNRMSFLLWRRKSKSERHEKPDAVSDDDEHEAAAENAPIPVTQEQEPTSTAAAAADHEPEAEPETVPTAADLPRKEPIHETPDEPEATGATTVLTDAPEGAPAAITEPSEYNNSRPAVGRAHTSPREDSTEGGIVKHVFRPISSPKADSKLKTWFRDRLVRRTSGPVQVFPHQPGPGSNNSSVVGFTGGAALAGRSEVRGAALNSHPVTGADLDQSEPTRGSNSLEVYKTATEDSALSSQEPSSPSKRERFRRTFLKSSRNSAPPTTGSSAEARKSPEPTSETKVTGSDIRGLRDSAAVQGLPVPPVLGETASVGRESRFSEDLS